MNVLNLPQRIYFLEAIRSLAALYVFIYHILQRISVDNKLLKLFFSFGQESVMIFFVLSGFVIFYSQMIKQKEIQVKKYLIARFSRIYPVFLFALIISYLCYCISQNRWVSPQFLNLFENILMLQDFSTGKPGVLFAPYMGDTPLWSLSYEWWFYLLFLLVIYIRSRYQLHIVFFVSLVSLFIYLYFPNQISLWLMYFLIWWSGVEAAKRYLGDTGKSYLWNIFYLLIMIFTLIIYALLFHHSKKEFGIFPILFIRHFTMALLFFCFLVYFNVASFKISEKHILVKLAPYSYAFYVLHYPVLNLFETKGWLSESKFNLLILLFTVIILTWIAENFIHKYLNVFIKKTC